MQHFNKIMLLGNVGGDPEFSQHGEVEVAKFSLATTKKWKTKGTDEVNEKTVWHNITCFGPNARYARDYIKKGAECFVTGEQINGSYTNDDGIKVNTSEVITERVSANTPRKKDDTSDATPKGGALPEVPVN